MAEPTHSDPRLAIAEVLWDRRPVPTRGPKATVTVASIAAAAVRIADQDGVASVSMQRVAEGLDVTKMALYRHLPSKDALLAVMIDQAIGEPPDLRDAAGWRAKLLAYVEQLWSVWQAHPWLPGVTVGSRLMGPNETAWAEAALGALAGTGLDHHEQIDAVLLVSAQVRMSHSRSTAGSYPWDSSQRLTSPMAEILADHADAYPKILAVSDSNGGRRIRSPTDGIGLELVLLGIEHRISATTPGKAW